MSHKPKGVVAQIDQVNNIYRHEVHCGRRVCPESENFIQSETIESWLVGWGERYYDDGLSREGLIKRTQQDADLAAEKIGNHCIECRRS